MDNHKENKVRKQSMKTKSTKRHEKKYKAGKLFRRKSMKSVGNFMNRILKTLGTLAHFGDVEPPDAEDDDGGFRDSATCTLSTNSGNLNKDELQVSREIMVKKSPSTLSSHGSIKDRLSWCYGDKTPGVLGLKNHGNTCFMNAVVQCLSNTDLLAEYLGLEQYKSDLCQGRVNGIVKSEDAQYARGEVTTQLASLVRALWTFEYTPQLSVEFKSAVSKYGSQFRGNSQHDALEFLLWLLDRVHEDANPSSNNQAGGKIKANAKGVVGGGEDSPGSSLAAAHQPGARHSFVQEHFQAQYRSSLTCPHCLKQSNTFDPFLCISLPIPLRQTRCMCVVLVFSTKGQRYLRVGLAVPLIGSIAHLRSMVAEEGKITADEVILSELYTTGFQRSFHDDDDLTSIAESDVVYAFQAPPLHMRGGSTRISGYHHSLPSSPYTSGQEGQRLPPSTTLSSEFLNYGGSTKVLLVICNTAGSGQQAVRFGPPFLTREERSLSWDQLQQSLLSKLYYLMLNGSQAQNAGVLFKIRVVGGSASYSYLSPQDARPLFHPAVDRALKLCGPGGPPHVKLVIEWDHKTKECLFGNIQEEVVKDGESVRLRQQQHLHQHSCTLDECFQLYTKEEQLAPDDAWKCPHCKQLQQGMVKMSLWTLPDILILHLKRFRQVGERRNKLSTQVRFPLAGLDMAPHVVKRSQSMRNLGNLGPWPPVWKQPSSSHHISHPDMALPPDYLYDLYAVCNHHGGMHGGHYTAYCRNSVDGQWYSYDDSSVDLVPEEEVCTRGAYILFYQRRNVIPPWSASSSVRGSTSSSMSDHWLIRLNGDSKRGSLVSRSSTTCPSSVPDSPESPVFLDDPAREEKGGFETRPFVRGIQGRSVSMRTPTKPKETLTKVLPLRWSFGSKDRRNAAPAPVPSPVELVEYLESGRRPRCTKDSIVNLMTVPPGTKEAPESRPFQPRSAVSSPGVGSSLSCMGQPKSPKLAEGQRRPVPDKTGSLRRSSRGQQRDEAAMSSSSSSNTLTRRSSRKTKEEQGRSQEAQSRRGSSTGVPTSSSTPSFRDRDREGTLKRGAKGHADPPPGDRLPPEGDKTRPGEKGEATSRNEGILSFFKSNFKRRESSRRSDTGKVPDVNGSRSTSRLHLSNGAPGGGSASEEPRPNGAPRTGGSAFFGDELPNGKSRRAADMKRSQSSSNIPTREESSLRRTASLHRNGLSHGVAPPPRSLMAEKPSYGTLQRTRYSTTSLGRKRTVPESTF
ncbi:ubiquitin carboxyl-terminal hydrolase 43a isoform X2 [Esox lucius]|uniref:ubiquitin carboxyl-terminal hydrolase 43a isoform X2 n=1 Tax=Esox lucius TaxID=8010 RepID=UPI0014774020|nr:ubiquitin carboxyl-terminal hydrolase 43a isoform X2 [Esox lucius]